MRAIRADLHIHTGLSPCASDEMTPPAIVRAAIDRGLEMIAICDHNSAGNAAATQAAAGGRLAVLAGLEITTAEEVHVVALFGDAASAQAAARDVQATLPEATAASRKLGEQRLMDPDGRVIGTEPKMLSGAASLGLPESVALIKRHGGLAIAAHVDRPRFSVLSQLGVFPADAGFDAVEVFSASGPKDVARQVRRPAAPNRDAGAEGAGSALPVLASSDSHYLSEIGRVSSVLSLFKATFAELALALRGIGGRGVRCA